MYKLLVFLLHVRHVVSNTCEPIRFEGCLGLGYNMTSLPNYLGQEIISEAEYSLSTFKPLITFECSSQLRFFLCSFYMPMCLDGVPQIGPCRNVCLGVKKRCAPVLEGFGFSWPPAIDCSLLPPVNNDDHMCMKGPRELVPLIPPPTNPRTCLHHIYPQLFIYVNESNKCASLCSADVNFSSQDKLFAAIWIAIWSLAVFCLTLFVLFSQVLASSVFKYPERAAINICLSYAFVATGFLVRLVLGADEVSCFRDKNTGLLLNIVEGTLNSACLTVFLLLYYFFLASGIWWIILSCLWLLKSWKQWTHKTVVGYSYFFHLFGWGISGVVTAICLIFRKIDTDELTGNCFPGSQSTETLIYWVMLPQFMFLTVGSTITALALASLWRMRKILRSRFLSHSHIDLFAARISILAVLYMIPSTFLIAIMFYEVVNRKGWNTDPDSVPSVEVFMLKIFMTLAPGLLISLFLINAKVLNAWKDVYRRCLGKKVSKLELHDAKVQKVYKYYKNPGHEKIVLPKMGKKVVKNVQPFQTQLNPSLPENNSVVMCSASTERMLPESLPFTEQSRDECIKSLKTTKL